MSRQFDVSYKPNIFFANDYPDLERAWQSLPGGPDALHARSGEVWQYMGTWYIQDQKTLRWHWMHQFRHRCHPFDEQRKVINILAGDWT